MNQTRTMTVGRTDMSDEALQTVAEGSTDFTDPTDGLDFASTFADAAGTCSQ